jgi:hypothetical protein
MESTVRLKCYKHDLVVSIRNLLFFFFKPIAAGSWWLTPVILATQEADTKRIKVQS